MKKTVWAAGVIIFAALLLTPQAFAADSGRFEPQIRYWAATLDASGVITDIDPDVELDLDRDLGLDGAGLPELSFSYVFAGGDSIRASYTRVKFTGEETLDGTLSIGGIPINIGIDVSSELGFDYLRAGWLKTLGSSESGSSSIKAVLEGKLFLAEALAEADLGLGTVEGSGEFDLATPSVGLRIDASPQDYMSIHAEATGFYWPDYGRTVDVEAGVSFSPFDNLRIEVGYRYLKVRYEENGDWLDMTITGPYAGLTLLL